MAKQTFTPSARQLQELLDTADPRLVPQALLREREYLHEALDAVELEIQERLAAGEILDCWPPARGE